MQAETNKHWEPMIMPDISESITAVPGEGRTRLVTG